MKLTRHIVVERHSLPGLGEPPLVRRLLVSAAVAFLGMFLVLPLILVFSKAFSEGASAYAAALADPMTLAAVRLTLLAAVVAVPLNLVFGVAAAWLLTRFTFRGRQLLLTMIDVPFSVSPVVAGLSFVLLFGAQGPLAPWLTKMGIRILFAPPGVILATLFVTVPFVARELIPILESRGTQEEQAALTLGAGGWRTFFQVSLPPMRWGLLYGCILCNARAMGEFGAVSVVSGHIRGRTNTLPLHVEVLYNEYQFAAAFAVATILTALALTTLILKAMLERYSRRGTR
ncbi:MAG: sulfate ABC transporter permease subunit CysW [Candidatus Eisenbacteria bacterium]|uniref:Sulfate ABC transporter permease subunit CysW n=1 Tax=Eiseniibacteriota bacterium TaxID=2212470 RepID=A0A948W706_UNCEI|nr:sulfate ABC transporter permease subunit CysW [Candidatus Eisenbacteria bacterium]MBU1949063.1 sulfate ABC transporter permease subunit CysW [Candidatus Eisenbacteria bacterium]MBU2691166.1 sulfate ABC transporter permease subunit CysW [Candidatus Eisenbacteria bacterium]